MIEHGKPYDDAGGKKHWTVFSLAKTEDGMTLTVRVPGEEKISFPNVFGDPKQQAMFELWTSGLARE